ncbi:MAG TPA: c-type cytochrome [Candidatus Binatia bacterium]|jgi:mono/diheme cytochrome c family protein
MTRARLSIVLTLLALLAPARGNAAGADGKQLYAHHCASCHGPSGRGDGPDAGLFATPPRDLRGGFLAKYTTDDLVKRVRNGTPLVLALDVPALRARATEVEALAAHLERLPAVDWRVVERGEEVFVDRCEICHGRSGQPGGSLPPGVHAPRDLTDPAFQKDLRDDQVATAIRDGHHDMPGLVPRVPESDLPALLAYIRLLSPGYVLYDRYCAACHGDDGRGTGTFTEATVRPSVVFDRAYFRRRDPEQVRAAVWHMLDTQRPAMPHLRRKLTAQQARAIIAYLRGGSS